MIVISPGDYSAAIEAQRLRQLLRRAALSPQAAARELEIDEVTMRGYCTGRPVPRCVALAIERLADVRSRKVYHITKAESAVDVLEYGFRDATGTYMSGSVHTGVWVSDKLLVHQSDIDLNEMACFQIKVSKEWLLRHERGEKGKAYREFLVPAVELNEFPRRRLPDKEWLSMPWGR
jgi:hypothetical protein